MYGRFSWLHPVFLCPTLSYFSLDVVGRPVKRNSIYLKVGRSNLSAATNYSYDKLVFYELPVGRYKSVSAFLGANSNYFRRHVDASKSDGDFMFQMKESPVLRGLLVAIDRRISGFRAPRGYPTPGVGELGADRSRPR